MILIKILVRLRIFIGGRKISIDQTERYMQMISKIKSRNNDLTQKTNEILSTKDNMNLYERGSNRHRKMQIESSQPLPPYFPHNDTRFENIPRPDST